MNINIDISKLGVKTLLEISAITLAIVNGLILLKNHLRDKSKLVVEPAHSNGFLWYFRLPGREFEGNETRKYGFLIYMSIINKGLRDVSLISWRLQIKLKNNKLHELKPCSIPEPKIMIGNNMKYYPLMGQRGKYCEGDTMIKAGSGISGFSYYGMELYGSNLHNPIINEGIIKGEYVIKNVFGKKSRVKINLEQKSLEEVKKYIEDIENIENSYNEQT